MRKAGYRFLDHTADVQVKIWAPTLEEAFSQTALSLMVIITPNLEKVSPIIEKKIKVKAEDKEALLFDFLSEFLYIFDVEELVFSKIEVLYIKKVNNDYELVSILKGEKFNKDKHDTGTIIKAVTYHLMAIKEKKNKVQISIVFDI